MNILDKKIVVIIGASRGIGVGVAKVFLEKGAIVILSARDETRLLAVKTKLEFSSFIDGILLVDVWCGIVCYS